MLSYINEQGVEVMLDAKNAEITRKINGDYTLSFMAIDEPDLVEELIVVCEGQNYRIKQLSSMMSGNKIIQSATCKHISNDLIDYYAYDYLTNTVTLNKALQFLFEGTPFTYSISGSVSNKSFEKLGEMNKQKLLATIIDAYGLEYEVDNYHFTFKKTVGYETEFQFRYKANISNVKKDIDTTSLTTYIKGYGKKDDEGNYLCTAEYTSPNAEKFGVRHADPVFDERYTIQSALLEYIKTKLNDTPDIVVELDYTQIDASQPINLGDYGYLIHEPLQLDLLSRVIEITKKLSTDRQGNNYQNMTYKIGSQKLVKSSFETNKDSITGDLNIPDVDYDKIQAEIDKGKQEATDMINSGLGGYVTKTRNELLIMDTEDTATARNLWRWNINGLGFSSNGYSGPYAIAITSDGKINADRILVGTIDGALIRANTIQTNSLELSTVQKINNAISATDATNIVTTKLEAYDGTIKTHIQQTADKVSQDAIASANSSTDNKLQNYPTLVDMQSAIEQTASSITSTVSQNYYTKQETDGKVTIVQNSMNSSITQLSNQIATKVDVNGVKSTIEQNPSSVQIGFNKISDALMVSPNGLIAKTQSGNIYFQLGYNGMTMYNPANGTHQWGKVAAINNKFTVASNGNSSGLSLGHHVNENYVEDILCDSNGVVSVHRQINHDGIYNNTYGQINIRQSGQGGWEITGRSDSQSIKPGGANQGGIGSNTQYINQSWIANRYNPSSLEIKHLSHYVDDLECLKLVSEVQPARYFYKEYDEEGNDITTFTTRTSQLGLIYEDVRECTGRDLITNEEDKAINLYNMVSTLWGAVRNLNQRLNELEIENLKLNNELEQIKATRKEVI